MAKEIWQLGEGDLPYEDEAMRAHARSMVFPIGQPNNAYARFFVGQSYLAPVSTSQVGVIHLVDFAGDYAIIPCGNEVLPRMIPKPLITADDFCTMGCRGIGFFCA